MVWRKAFTLSVLPVLYLLGQVAGPLPTTTPSTRPELKALPLPTG